MRFSKSTITDIISLFLIILSFYAPEPYSKYLYTRDSLQSLGLLQIS